MTVQALAKKMTRRSTSSESVQAPRPAAERGAAAGVELAVGRFLRSFQVLLRSGRLYQKNHPRVLESLEAVERNLRAALEFVPSVAVGVERGHLVVPALGSEASGHPLYDRRGELNALAEELSKCGVTSLVFLPQTNLGELDTLAESLNSALQRPGAEVARLGHHLSTGRTGDAITLEELTAALRLLLKMIPPLEQAHQSSAEDTAGAFHAALAEADPRAVGRLVKAIVSQAPHEGDAPEPYVARLVDTLVIEFATAEFCAGRLAPAGLRELFDRLSGELAAAGGPLSEVRRAGVGAVRPFARAEPMSLFARWADETYAASLSERFWSELPAREMCRVLRSRDAWCVPVAALRRYLEQLADADPRATGGASPREARLVLLNYARCVESEEGKTRRAVATGLVELHPLFERIWPHQLPEELSRVVVRALELEASPGIAGLLSAVTENLARLATQKGDYAEFERILTGLERAPRDADHAHLTALAEQLVSDERWLLLVDAALGNRPLDPVLPRLLRRDPERLLDRLGLLLTAARGLDALPAMARLLRAVGEPALGALEMRLFEPRRQRATAAIKLLAATEPGRLLQALPRALPSWDWNLQDLAVTELARTDLPGVAWAFLETVTEAHPLVVPVMLDQIGLAGEAAAVPLLLSIAAGERERLRDVFIRIKAVEALGRMRATEAANLLRALLRQRNGLTHAEPAGLRAAAEEALALIENRPSSARVRAAQEALERASVTFTRPRRYLRIPLSSPFAAQIEGPHAGPATVRTISLGGAYLESNRRLAVGDSIRVEIRTGLRRIQSTAVVRNVTPQGGGVEFVHMKQEDREKLRKLVRRLLRN
ncbi:MAG: PilZ domain-containing protein [Acidobacteria bacterium]|nr:PilZ domain-containing protein [Acidobacteriota bacterium]